MKQGEYILHTSSFAEQSLTKFLADPLSVVSKSVDAITFLNWTDDQGVSNLHKIYYNYPYQDNQKYNEDIITHIKKLLEIHDINFHKIREIIKKKYCE